MNETRTGSTNQRNDTIASTDILIPNTLGDDIPAFNVTSEESVTSENPLENLTTEGTRKSSTLVLSHTTDDRVVQNDSIPDATAESDSFEDESGIGNITIPQKQTHTPLVVPTATSESDNHKELRESHIGNILVPHTPLFSTTTTPEVDNSKNLKESHIDNVLPPQALIQDRVKVEDAISRTNSPTSSPHIPTTSSNLSSPIPVTSSDVILRSPTLVAGSTRPPGFVDFEDDAKSRVIESAISTFPDASNVTNGSGIEVTPPPLLLPTATTGLDNHKKLRDSHIENIPIPQALIQDREKVEDEIFKTNSSNSHIPVESNDDTLKSSILVTSSTTQSHPVHSEDDTKIGATGPAIPILPDSSNIPVSNGSDVEPTPPPLLLPTVPTQNAPNQSVAETTSNPVPKRITQTNAQPNFEIILRSVSPTVKLTTAAAVGPEEIAETVPIDGKTPLKTSTATTSTSRTTIAATTAATTTKEEFLGYSSTSQKTTPIPSTPPVFPSLPKTTVPNITVPELPTPGPDYVREVDVVVSQGQNVPEPDVYESTLPGIFAGEWSTEDLGDDHRVPGVGMVNGHPTAQPLDIQSPAHLSTTIPPDQQLAPPDHTMNVEGTAGNPDLISDRISPYVNPSRDGGGPISQDGWKNSNIVALVVPTVVVVVIIVLLVGFLYKRRYGGSQAKHRNDKTANQTKDVHNGRPESVALMGECTELTIIVTDEDEATENKQESTDGEISGQIVRGSVVNPEEALELGLTDNDLYGENAYPDNLSLHQGSINSAHNNSDDESNPLYECPDNVDSITPYESHNTSLLPDKPPDVPDSPRPPLPGTRGRGPQSLPSKSLCKSSPCTDRPPVPPSPLSSDYCSDSADSDGDCDGAKAGARVESMIVEYYTAPVTLQRAPPPSGAVPHEYDPVYIPHNDRNGMNRRVGPDNYVVGGRRRETNTYEEINFRHESPPPAVPARVPVPHTEQSTNKRSSVIIPTSMSIYTSDSSDDDDSVDDLDLAIPGCPDGDVDKAPSYDCMLDANIGEDPGGLLDVVIPIYDGLDQAAAHEAAKAAAAARGTTAPGTVPRSTAPLLRRLSSRSAPDRRGNPVANTTRNQLKEHTSDIDNSDEEVVNDEDGQDNPYEAIEFS